MCNNIDVTIKRSEVQVLENYSMCGKEVVKVYKQGEKFADVVYVERTTGQGIKKLSKDTYVELKTGEVKEFQHNEVKQIENLRKTFERLRRLIRHNFTEDSNNQLFVTLTYASNMTDSEQLYIDFKNFMKRLRYAYPEHKFDYIVVAEPQKRGAWHMHLMLKTDQSYLYLDNEQVSAIWGDENIVRQALVRAGFLSKKKAYTISLNEAYSLVKEADIDLPNKYKPLEGHGWATTERLKSDDVGTYYVAYFTDLEVEANQNEARKDSKKYEKGMRLSYYPVGFKFYRTSRGIEQPLEEHVEYIDVVKEYGKPVYEKAFSIVKDDEVVNVIYKSAYKKSN